MIVPFDAADNGEPLTKGNEASGYSAHWVALIGWYQDSRAEGNALYYNWGGFYTGSLNEFGISNAQLTSNDFLPMRKVELAIPSKNYLLRDYVREDEMTSMSRLHKRFESGGATLKLAPQPVNNPEH